MPTCSRCRVEKPRDHFHNSSLDAKGYKSACKDCYRKPGSVPRAKTLTEAFWRGVTPGDPHECWEWQRGKHGFGHGVFKFKWDHYYAHRVSYMIHIGPIPDDMEVCHNCPGGDNPSCVNPAHLFLGTHAENMRDAQQKRSHAYGERSGMAKLTTEKVQEIRSLLHEGVLTNLEIAAMFAIDATTVCNIGTRKTWKHLPDTSPETADKSRYIRGERHHGAKLTANDVQKIRALLRSGAMYQREIGNMFGVQEDTIYAIGARRTWKHIP